MEIGSWARETQLQLTIILGAAQYIKKTLTLVQHSLQLVDWWSQIKAHYSARCSTCSIHLYTNVDTTHKRGRDAELQNPSQEWEKEVSVNGSPGDFLFCTHYTLVPITIWLNEYLAKNSRMPNENSTILTGNFPVGRNLLVSKVIGLRICGIWFFCLTVL